MIIFKTLTLRNFLSYGNNVTTIELDRPGTTLIVGEDLDNQSDDLVGSNGVGKTTAFQAMIYALFDRVISEDARVDELINNVNKREMEVTLEFVAENGSTYKVVRYRKMKSGSEGNGVRLYENGKDISVAGPGTNKKIVEILGMHYELFVRIVVFSASNKSFLKLPVTHASGPNQKQFIEDLFGLTVITEKAEKLKSYIKDTKALIEAKKAQIDARMREQERHQQQVEAAKTRLNQWEVRRSQQISALNQSLTSLDGVDLDQQRSLHTKRREIEATVREITTEHAQMKRECRSHLQNYQKLSDEIEALSGSKCPYCEQHFAGALTKVEAKNQELLTLNSTIDDLSVRVKEYDAMLADLSELLKTLTKGITVDDVESLAKIQADSENIKRRIEELKTEENPHAETITSLNDVEFDPIDASELEALQVELEHQNFLLKLLTKSDSFVRKNLLNKYLPFLNSRVQCHLGFLGLPHTVEFQEDLTAKITLRDVEVGFGLMSTGQRARVDFAFSVAFKDVRERLHGRTNICVFDEVLDFGMDAIGVVACAKLIRHLAKSDNLSVYVISHRSEVERMFDRKMTIQMKDKFSHVKLEEVRE